MNIIEIAGKKAMTTGNLGQYLGVGDAPLPLNIKMLTDLGLQPFHTEKAGKAAYWSMEQVPQVIDALIKHLQDLRP